MSFDIISVETVDTITVDILHPVTQKPTGVKVEVASYESDRVKAVQRRIANANLKKQRRKLSAEQIEQNTLDVACAAVISWAGYERDGKPVECSPENVREVMQIGWFATQIDEAASDQTAFIKA